MAKKYHIRVSPSGRNQNIFPQNVVEYNRQLYELGAQNSAMDLLNKAIGGGVTVIAYDLDTEGSMKVAYIRGAGITRSVPDFNGKKPKMEAHSNEDFEALVSGLCLQLANL